jgi:hypothetical protein
VRPSSLGKFVVAQDRDELFAERPCCANCFDAAFDRQNASGGDVSGGDVIHGVPLSLHLVDEDAGEVTASRALGLGCVPVRADPLCRGVRLERDDQLDLGERDL